MGKDAEGDKKTEGAKGADDKDDKGVPWENRAKEFERKHAELLKENEALKAQIDAAPMESGGEDDGDGKTDQEETKKKLLEFVSDPDSYIESILLSRQAKRELPQAVAWLKEQSGYTPDDNARIAQVISEYGINHPSPLVRAKAAWQFIRSERLEKEAADKAADGKREKDASKTMPEGVGKSQAKGTGPKRADLLKQLAAAENRGDWQQSSELINLLEDVRA